MTEYFDVVDENDRVIGRATRKECHSNPELIHRASIIHIFNSKGELLLQKRSMKKDMNPGKWTSSASGHTDIGESYEEAAKRELREELGVELPLKFLFKYQYRTEKESEINWIFTAKCDGPFRPDPEEVDEVKFFSLDELKRLFKKNPDMFTPGCRGILGEYFKMFGGKAVI